MVAFIEADTTLSIESSEENREYNVLDFKQSLINKCTLVCGKNVKIANFMYGYIFFMYYVVYNIGTVLVLNILLFCWVELELKKYFFQLNVKI